MAPSSISRVTRAWGHYLSPGCLVHASLESPWCSWSMVVLWPVPRSALSLGSSWHPTPWRSLAPVSERSPKILAVPLEAPPSTGKPTPPPPMGPCVSCQCCGPACPFMCGHRSLCPQGCWCACRMGAATHFCCPPARAQAPPGTGGCSGDSRTELQPTPGLGLVFDSKRARTCKTFK